MTKNILIVGTRQISLKLIHYQKYLKKIILILR